MTHNIGNSGDLNDAEYKWLEGIVRGMDRSTLSDRLIFAATWADDIEDDQAMQKIRTRLREQINSATNGADIQFVEVSAKMYKSGVEKGKKGLQDKSGIPAFRELVISAGNRYAQKAESLRKAEIQKLCRESRDRLNGLKRELSADIDSKKSRVRRKYEGAFEKWRGILNRFTSMRGTVQSKLSECRSIESDSSFERRIYDM